MTGNIGKGYEDCTNHQGYALLNAVYLVLSVVGLVKWNRLRDRRPVGEA